jgi:hypothetical protein
MTTSAAVASHTSLDPDADDTTDEDNTSELQATLVSLQRVVDNCQRKRQEIEAALAGNTAARKHVASYVAVLVIDNQPNFLVTTNNTRGGKWVPVKVG